MILRTIAFVAFIFSMSLAMGGVAEEAGFDNPFVEDAQACQYAKNCGCKFDPRDASVRDGQVDTGLRCYS